MELNIVELIENNPITKLSNNYHSKLLTKIKENFTESQQQLFVSSFYCYLNYNQTNEFIIDLDEVWIWLGFSAKASSKRILDKYFVNGIDYKVSLCTPLEQKKGSGGHNKETILLSIKTFKALCLKACTKKADEIHEYYIKLEEILNDVIKEESNELKLQLENKTKELEQQKIELDLQSKQSEKDKYNLLEKTLLSQFPINTQCIYYGMIDNKTLGKAPKLHNEDLIKFGQSNNLSERVKCHKKNFLNFRLLAAFKVQNKIEIENAIKRHPVLKNRLRSIQVENPNYEEDNYRELLAIDEDKFTIEKINEYIKEIINEKQYNIENYNLLIEKNYNLEDDLRKLEDDNKKKDLEIEKLKIQLEKYTPDITSDFQKKIKSNYAVCHQGYYLYAFECEDMRYKCSIIRIKDFEKIESNLQDIDKNGSMKYYTKVLYPFTEKIMTFILKKSLICLGNYKYEGGFEEIKKIIDISAKLEKILIEKSDDIDVLGQILDGTHFEKKENGSNDPELSSVKKAKRSIDKINPLNGEIIATFESIEAAGRSLGLTTGTAVGYALREKRICQGFIFRYTGISKEDQFTDQPVVKVRCSTGEKVFFDTIADAAKDAKISPPGLRNRILRHVHINDFHWIFDKNSTHYKS